MHVEPPCEQGVASTDRTWGGPNERLTGDSIPRRVTPSRVQLAVSKPAQSPLFYRRGSFALRSVPRVTSAPTFGDPSQLSGCPNGSISRWPATPLELLRRHMRLEYGLEAQRLLPLLPTMVGSPSS
jgi:hypothetical protein